MGRHSCCYKQKLRKGLWSPEEDEKLIKHITKFGHGCWSSVPKLAGPLSLLLTNFFKMHVEIAKKIYCIVDLNLFELRHNCCNFSIVFNGSRSPEVWKKL